MPRDDRELLGLLVREVWTHDMLLAGLRPNLRTYWTVIKAAEGYSIVLHISDPEGLGHIGHRTVPERPRGASSKAWAAELGATIDEMVAATRRDVALNTPAGWAPDRRDWCKHPLWRFPVAHPMWMGPGEQCVACGTIRRTA